MRRPGAFPAVAVAAVILTLLMLYTVWPEIPTNGPPSVPGTPTGGSGTQAVNGLSYATKNVSLPGPTDAADWTATITVPFENVTWCLWTVGWTSASGVVLEGTALEPNGARMGFAFWPEPGVNRWFAPDGTFGVGNLSVSAEGASALLYVAKPMRDYAYLAAQVHYPAPNETPVAQTLGLNGVTFNLSVQHVTLGGPWLVGSARMSNGTEYAINISAGPAPRMACSLSGGMPNYWGEAICLEWSSVERTAGVLWDGLRTVGLLALGASKT